MKEQQDKSGNKGGQQDTNLPQGQGITPEIMQIFHPKDFSHTIESALNVIQGKPDKLPDLMSDIGNIVLKVSKRMSPMQIILSVGVLTLGAVFIARSMEYEFEEND